MRTIKLLYPSRLAIGAGCMNELLADIKGWGVKKIFILTFPEMIPVIQPFISNLEKNALTYSIDESIRQEPTISDFERVMATAKEYSPDLVLGMGGGSILDVAKLVAALIFNNQSLGETIGINRLTGRKALLACMPTNSGTGSEVSPNAILLDEDEHLKKAIISPYLVPDLCYVDPGLTLTAPPSVTAATGIDAFTHCLEAYVNRHAHPVVDLYAIEGMRLIAGSLVAAVRDGSDIAARTHLSIGSLYGGMCLGPVNTAAIHALSYPLGSQFHTAHGLANAVLLPYVMEFNLPAATERYAKVAGILGVEERGTQEARAKAGIEAVRKLLTDCGIPVSLADIGIPSEAIPGLAESAMKVQRLLVNNPREVTLEDAISIYTKAS